MKLDRDELRPHFEQNFFDSLVDRDIVSMHVYKDMLGETLWNDMPGYERSITLQLARDMNRYYMNYEDHVVPFINLLETNEDKNIANVFSQYVESAAPRLGKKLATQPRLPESLLFQLDALGIDNLREIPGKNFILVLKSYHAGLVTDIISDNISWFRENNIKFHSESVGTLETLGQVYRMLIERDNPDSKLSSFLSKNSQFLELINGWPNWLPKE